MIGRGLSGVLGTACVVGIGLGALATEKVVSESGPEVITEPVIAVLQRFQPLGDAVGSRLADLKQKLEVAIDPSSDTEVQEATEATLAEVEVPESVVGSDGQAPKEMAAVDTDVNAATEVRIVGDCAPEGENADVAVLGDRLALRFFEQSALASAPSGDSGATSQSIVFERLDLSGSYEVISDGSVSLPAIGHVDVIGRGLSCIETLVARAANERMRLHTSVNAAFAARPPVLVRGIVRAPGAHAYSPGLTVERVLAQAGVIDRAQPLSSLQLVSLTSREDELMSVAASLVIERARIDALLDGDVDFGSDADAWTPVIESLGPDRVKLERDLLLSEIAAQAAENQQMNDRIDSLVFRIESAQAGLSAAQDQLAFLHERQGKLQGHLAKGVTNESRVAEATAREMDMTRVVLEKRFKLLELEADLRLARNELDMRQAERRRQMISAARETTKERSAVREQLLAVRAQLSVQNEDDSATFMVTIERPDPNGTDRFPADAGTFVRPGDLVIVGVPDTIATETTIAEVGTRHLETLRSVKWP